MKKTPLVSVCSITYNHAGFIRQCLESLVSQKVNFPFEIIINDDCSTDGTTEIIREYADKYPDIIVPIYHEENLYSKGVRGIFNKFVFPRVRGKYVALCEGDDYWLSPDKLQKQVDFLESHPDYSLHCHRVKVVNSDESEIIKIFPDWLEKDTTLTLQDLEKGNKIQTNSVLYRWRFGEGKDCLENYVWEDVMPQDYLFHMLHAATGKIYYSYDLMSAYRVHDGGIWSSTVRKGDIFLQRFGYNHLLMYVNARAVLPLKFESAINYLTGALVRYSLRNYDFEVLAKVSKLFPKEVEMLFKASVEASVKAAPAEKSKQAAKTDYIEEDKYGRLANRYAILIRSSKVIYRISRWIEQLYLLFTGKKKKK